MRSWLAGLHEAGEVTPTTIAKAYRLLRRRHVDLAGARLHVVEQAAEVRGKIIVGPHKTEAGRRAVTLPAVAVEALAEHLDRYALPGPDGLVFTNSAWTHIKRSHFSRWAWRPAVHQLGLDGLRFHDLRHTAATLAAAAGATTKELMERIGPTSPSVALHYQHVMAEPSPPRSTASPQKAVQTGPRARGGHDPATVQRQGKAESH